MDLTQKDIKFLTIMNETRISDGKLLKGYSDEVKKQFEFTNKELNVAVKKLRGKGMLSAMDLGGDEVMYFFTEKVSEEMLDKKLVEISH